MFLSSHLMKCCANCTYNKTYPENVCHFVFTADIDECNTTFPCSQGCVNSYGTFHCYCADGYRLLPDRMTCGLDNECKSSYILSPAFSQHSSLQAVMYLSYSGIFPQIYKGDPRTVIPPMQWHHKPWTSSWGIRVLPTTHMETNANKMCP